MGNGEDFRPIKDQSTIAIDHLNEIHYEMMNSKPLIALNQLFQLFTHFEFKVTVFSLNVFICLTFFSVYLKDQTSNYSDDLDTDDLASLLNNWEDPSSDTGVRSPGQPSSHEKLGPILDVSVGLSGEPVPEAAPPGPSPMDGDADVSTGERRRFANFLKAKSKKANQLLNVGIKCIRTLNCALT